MKTIGEKRMRVDFTKPETDKVGFEKQEVAKMINRVLGGKPIDSEHARLKAMAATELEMASMLVTRALTYKPEEETIWD